MQKTGNFLLQNKICRHILFWAVSYYYLLHFFLISDQVEKIDYIYTFVFHIPILIAVYTNLLFLIPTFLSRKKYIAWLTGFLLLLLGSVLLNRFIFNVAIDYLAPDYFFVADLGWLDLLQFSLVYMGLSSLIKLSGAWFALQESSNRLIHLEKEKINAELSFLRSQVNPHFLFNSLNNIYSLVLKQDTKAAASLVKLSSVMRYMIYESDEEMVLLKKEIEYLTSYIELQKLRVRDEAAISFTVEGATDGQRIAPLILIVFIENAFKHGAATGFNQFYVRIRITVRTDSLQLIAENEKGILDEMENLTYKGLGIENVRRRLELIYNGKYSLQVDDTDAQYRVILALPLLY